MWGDVDPRTATDRAPQPHLGHEALDRTTRDRKALARQFEPDFARTVHLLLLGPDASNLDAPLVVALCARTTPQQINVLDRRNK